MSTILLTCTSNKQLLDSQQFVDVVSNIYILIPNTIQSSI